MPETQQTLSAMVAAKNDICAAPDRTSLTHGAIRGAIALFAIEKTHNAVFMAPNLIEVAAKSLEAKGLRGDAREYDTIHALLQRSMGLIADRKLDVEQSEAVAATFFTKDEQAQIGKWGMNFYSFLLFSRRLLDWVNDVRKIGGKPPFKQA